MNDRIKAAFLNDSSIVARMYDLIRVALEDVADCFEIKEDLFQKYCKGEILKNTDLLNSISVRNKMKDLRKETPLGGPGTVLNGIVLYSLIRHYGLHSVLETGVSGGFYSTFLLAAIDKNGVLVSVEKEQGKEVGKLIPESLREKWILKDGTDSLKWLKNRVGIEYSFTLYCHDSLHTMSHMLQELIAFKECAMPRFFIYIDDQDADMFWKRCIASGAFNKPGYDVKYIDGKGSRLKGHLGGFLKYEQT